MKNGNSLYKKLVFWELELESSNDAAMSEILEAQKMEANKQFGRFIEKFYPDWFERQPSASYVSYPI